MGLRGTSVIMGISVGMSRFSILIESAFPIRLIFYLS